MGPGEIGTVRWHLKKMAFGFLTNCMFKIGIEMTEICNPNYQKEDMILKLLQTNNCSRLLMKWYIMCPLLGRVVNPWSKIDRNRFFLTLNSEL